MKLTIRLPEEVVDQIDEQLDYAETRSDWIQDAIEKKLIVEDKGPDEEGTKRPRVGDD